MATAREARDWAHATLRGIGNSLYTPFCGDDGDDIDWGAYQTLVRYCVGGLRHPMLWCTSGIAEFWSLTLDERKKSACWRSRLRKAVRPIPTSLYRPAPPRCRPRIAWS
jgi:dihydrodipicolinate synthase/N-acetylneuraminate lyase